MVAGLSPIIGEGEIGGFLQANGQRKILSLQDGNVLIDDIVVPKYGELLNEPLYTLKNPMPLVTPGLDSPRLWPSVTSANEARAYSPIDRRNYLRKFVRI